MTKDTTSYNAAKMRVTPLERRLEKRLGRYVVLQTVRNVVLRKAGLSPQGGNDEWNAEWGRVVPLLDGEGILDLLGRDRFVFQPDGGAFVRLDDIEETLRI